MGIINNMVKCFGQGDDYSQCNNKVAGITKMTDNNAKEYVNYVIAVAVSAINRGLAGGLNLVPENANQASFKRADLTKALLASRCVITSGASDTWKLIMATYYAMRAFNIQKYVYEGLNASMPTICACKAMVDSWAKMFGGNAETTAAELGNCSEGAGTASAS